MFEMLTGRVPFNGETTVAIAIKHIQEEFPCHLHLSVLGYNNILGFNVPVDNMIVVSRFNSHAHLQAYSGGVSLSQGVCPGDSRCRGEHRDKMLPEIP